MTVLSLAEAESALSQHIEFALRTHEPLEIFRDDVRVAVLVCADDFDSLLETLDILSNQAGLGAMKDAAKEVDDGGVSSTDSVRAAVLARGPLGH